MNDANPNCSGAWQGHSPGEVRRLPHSSTSDGADILCFACYRRIMKERRMELIENPDREVYMPDWTSLEIYTGA